MSEGDWPSGFDGHRRDQLRRIAATTPTQRVQWLEDMLFMLWRNGLIPSKLEPPNLKASTSEVEGE